MAGNVKKRTDEIIKLLKGGESLADACKAHGITQGAHRQAFYQYYGSTKKYKKKVKHETIFVPVDDHKTMEDLARALVLLEMAVQLIKGHQS